MNCNYENPHPEFSLVVTVSLELRAQHQRDLSGSDLPQTLTGRDSIVQWLPINFPDNVRSLHRPHALYPKESIKVHDKLEPPSKLPAGVICARLHCRCNRFVTVDETHCVRAAEILFKRCASYRFEDLKRLLNCSACRKEGAKIS